MFAFGHFALPLAAVLALGLLFVGIRIFFLSPPDRTEADIPSVRTSQPPEAGGGEESDRANVQQANPIENVEEVPLEPVTMTEADPAPPPSASAPVESITLAGPVETVEIVTRPSETKDKKAVKADTRPNRAVTPPNRGGTTRPAAPPANSKWAVQVGAFINQNSAATTAEEMRKLGHKATVSKSEMSGKTYHRVRVMAGNNRESANKLAAELERKGYPVAVVPVQ
jgi:cell division septation protein DedD